MYARLSATLLTAAVGLAALGPGAPAYAAAAPTISAPAAGLGYGPITITGTAPAGAKVTLIEAAYTFRSDMAVAAEYNNGDVISAVATSTGHYTLTRTLDSGFVFAVEAGGVRSNTIAVGLRLTPSITSATTSGTTVSLSVDAGLSGLSEAGLPVHIQRSVSGGAWTTIVTGHTTAAGLYDTTLAGQTAGARVAYRAYLEESLSAPTGYADPENDVWSNYSQTMTLTVGSSAAAVPTGAESTPAAPAGTPTIPSTPSTPTIPTKPSAPSGPAVGSIKFSKIMYDSPGKDTGTTASLNAEYFRLTNTTNKAINVNGWTVRDAAGHVYTFGSHLIGAGKTVYVHTGRGTNGKPDSAHRYWNKTSYIWNNGGDSAYLRSGSKTIDSCSYRASKSGYTYC
jgi:hypothetical protein